MNEIDKQSLPKHIAIIMDGNRRWAKNKGLPAKLGHAEGVKTLENITKYCDKIGIKFLTVYAFSTENWKRSKEEVDDLMNLLSKYIKDFDKKNDVDNIKVRIIGDITKLRQDLQEGIIRIQEKTKNNTGLTFNIAINYGGREEILKAIKELSNEVSNNNISVDDIDENVFQSHLYATSDVDLLIRTSGEVRISNFLLWQISYSEMYFTDTLWPDFKEKDLDEAIIEYQKRNRKFGGK